MNKPRLILPKSIDRLIDFARKELNPEKVLLFGSRARGDERELSDYDLAFVFDAASERSWNRFLVDVDELPITLLPVDLIAWNEASEQLRNQISDEGIVIYECAQTSS